MAGLQQLESSLKDLNLFWFNELKPKYLDVISEFAGQELFIIDVDALIQLVLDNELLALGRVNDTSFQLIHAKFIIEQLLNNLVELDLNFELVSFTTNKHFSIKTGSNHYITESRNLARTILIQHLHTIKNLKSHQFDSIYDSNYINFIEKRRPMFLLGHDGGLNKSISSEEEEGEKASEIERIMCQKVFLFNVMKSGLPVILIQAVEFKDGKMMSYFYNRIDKHSLISLSHSIIESSDTAFKSLESKNPSSSSSPEILNSITNSSDILLLALNSFQQDSTQSEADPLSSTFLHLFFLHITLLKEIPIASRAQNLPKLSTELSKYLVESFLPKLYSNISKVIESNGITDDLDIDGRIFTLLLLEVLTTSTSVIEIVGSSTMSSLTTSFPSLPPLDLSLLRTTFPSESNIISTVADSESNATLLPFSNPTFDPHFNKVHVAVSSQLTPATSVNQLSSDTSFNDTRIFEVPKPTLLSHQGTSGPPVVLDAREKKKKDRKEQRFMASMQKAASSLTGAQGSSLKQIVIPAVGRRSTVKEGKVSTVIKTSSMSGNRGKVVLSSKDKLLAENAAKKQVEESEQNLLWWNSKLVELKPLSIPSQISLLTGYLKNRRAFDKFLAPEMVLKRLDLEIRNWVALPNDQRENRLVGDAFRVFLARIINDLLLKYKLGKVVITEKQGKTLLNVLDAMGLKGMVDEGIKFGAVEPATSTSNGSNGKKVKPGKEKEKPGKKEKEKVPEKEESSSSKLSFSFISLTKSGKPLYDFMRIPEDENPVEFQLRCMGEHMIRSLDSQPDSRVNFEPDAWQIDVLNKIDANASMLVVAPTSSGKTFISFAAIEKVLRESDDGIVIYVAPSKALVNQVASEVFARFSKDVPGANMWAIHTRDYRINNPMTAQILVTVPHVLSQMLLSPALASVWTPRIKRIIVDEIHSISDSEGGAIWEQVLLMNPAPIIGLSATVGAPERFSAWLESIEKRSGRDYSLIIHTTRFNALRKIAYAPEFPIKRIGPLNEHKAKQTVFPEIHPIAALGLGESQLPEDLALEPRDCLSLVKLMKSIAPEKVPESLTPAVYFSNSGPVVIKTTLQYEKDIKSLLVEWMEDSKDSNSPYQQVVAKLEGPLKAALEKSEKEISEGGSDTFYSLFVPLLADLNAQGNLPAILFNFDRIECEKIGKRILEDLEEAEGIWRTKSPEFKKRVAKAKEDEKLAKLKAKANESSSKNKQDDEDLRGGGVDDDFSTNTFDPDAPSEEFSFVGKGISQVEFAKEISDLAWVTDLPGWLINALRRGIGIHHAGLNRRYRTTVENLYRRGVLRCVISTETLSLGINAPARTCVFAGDSTRLTSLYFRQCAGRAGRRGFDNLGLVLFVGVPLDRIQRLLLSRLPKLGGSFPLTTTLVLRLHNLLHGSTSELPSKTVDRLLSLPQLSVGNKLGQDQVAHFVRFSIEYLRRAGLLDESGKPLAMYGIASSLYTFEPSNFTLVSLLRSGVLHQITRSFETNSTSVLNELCLIFAHLFGRVLRRKQPKESLITQVRNSNSLMVLPKLPTNVAKVIKEISSSIVFTFSTFAKEFSQQHSEDLGPDDSLPLSKIKVITSPPTGEKGSFSIKLSQTAINYDSRSPFIATSGHGESYKSISELSTTARSGLVLVKHAIPAPYELTSKEHEIDSYVLDFFKHGSLDILIRDNSIERGAVWFKLQDYDNFLATLKNSLETLLQKSSEDREEDNDSDNGDDDADIATDILIVRPSGISDADWLLYSAIATLSTEFRTKFHKVFA